MYSQAPLSLERIARRYLHVLRKWNHSISSDVQSRVSTVTGSPNNRSFRGKSIKKTILESIEPELQQLIPDSFLNQLSSPKIRYSFTCSDSVAREIVDHIKPFISQSTDTVTIEVNPGIGLITKHLSAAGLGKMYVADKNPLDCIIAYAEQNSIPLKKTNLFSIYSDLYLESVGRSNVIKELYTEMQIASCQESPSVRIIGVLSDSNYLRYTAYTVLSDIYVHFLSRAEQFLIVPHHVFLNYSLESDIKHVRYYNFLLFHILMEFEIICSLPRKAFLPWPTGPSETFTSFEDMHLIRVSPKKDISNVLKNEEDLANLSKFLRATARKRTSPIIESLEQLIPGCGYDLILSGLNMSNLARDLRPTDFLTLFEQFSSLPGYEDVLTFWKDDPLNLKGINESSDVSKEDESLDIDVKDTCDAMKDIS